MTAIKSQIDVALPVLVMTTKLKLFSVYTSMFEVAILIILGNI